MRRFAHLGAVVATTAVLFPSLAAFNPAQAPSAPSERDGRDPLVVEEIGPEAVGPDSTVRIEGEVTNTTGAALGDVSVRMRYSGYPFQERSSLGDFAATEGPADQRTPAYGPDAAVDGPLEPGQTAAFTIEADAADLDLDGYGVYPVAVEAVDGGEGALATVRTFIAYEGSDDAPSPVDIAWVWPLMDYPRRTDDDTFLSTDLAASVGPEGRLGRLLTAGAQDPGLSLDPESAEEETASPEPSSPDASPSASAGADDEDGNGGGGSGGDGGDDADEADRTPVTWAVDPGLLADIERLAAGSYNVLEDTDVPGEGETLPVRTVEADPGARVWLDRTAAALQDAPLIATPYANPDVSSLLEAGLEDDLDAAVRLGGDTVQRTLGREADPSYALPPGGLIDTATLDYYADQGAETFLLSETALPPQPWVEHTATAAAPMEAGGGDATGIVIDPGLTEALGQPSRAPGEAALAQQRFIAETAMIGGEHTGDDRTVVAMPPTTWNPGEEFASGVLEASEDLPWLSTVDLSDVEPPKGESERRGPAGGDTTAESRLGQEHLERVDDIRGTVRLFNSILVEDVDPYRPAVLRAESAAWREEESRAARSLGLIGASVRNGLASVRIVPTEPVTLASKTGTIGVIIANDLQGDQEAVRIKLSMFSENPERMKIDDYQDEMEIGPGQKTTVYVPLEARINGRTMLYLSLQNTQGEPIASEETITPVNASGLGYQAMIISGLGALVLVVALTPRALRKWARKRAAALGDDPSAVGGDGGDGEVSEGSETGPGAVGAADADGGADTGAETVEKADDTAGDAADDDTTGDEAADTGAARDERVSEKDSADADGADDGHGERRDGPAEGNEQDDGEDARTTTGTSDDAPADGGPERKGDQ
ncbi:DUF6049 family protein [Nocardiopsis sp. RSe5-2]|uniref:DUF6049 family protein n=1 Tax=Nocardiopsis endophytica TaxID=3018445 RepID=A0ABT4U2L8_9ACTN|nr:DUF6049 family protein [Nocardiopsis endophytica]MDA2811192.1 DUF6049 family protein [Nocardiopsis endophytica]